MKPSRSSLFFVAGCAGLVTLAMTPFASAQNYFDNSTADWANLGSWSTSQTAATPDPAAVPGSAGALNAAVVFGTTTLEAITAGRTISLNGDYTVSSLSTSTNLNNTVTLAGGGTDRTLKIGTGGITHNKGGLIIGSTTAGQIINIKLLGSQTWNSITLGSSGSYVGQALVVRGPISLESAGAQTLTLSGSNSGTAIDGSISDGAGVLSLEKSGGTASNVWTLNGNNSFTGTVTVSEGILRVSHGNGIPNPAKLTIAAGKTVSIRPGATFTSSRINEYGNLATFGSTTSVLEFDTNSTSAEYNASYAASPTPKTFLLRKAAAGNLTLNGNSNLPGNVEVTGGGLILNGSTTLGGTVTLSGGALTLNSLSGSNTVNGVVTLGSSASLTTSGTTRFANTVTLASGTMTVSGATTFDKVVAVGANTLSLSGTTTFNTGSKVTVNGGTLVLGSPTTVGTSPVAKPIEFSGASSVVGIMGGSNGFTEASLKALRDLINTPATPPPGNTGPYLLMSGASLSYGVSTAGGDSSWDGEFFGAQRFVKSGPNTLVLNGTRPDTGGVLISGGILKIYDLGAGGISSGIGAASSAAANITLSGGTLMYAGGIATTDRLFNTTTNATLDASGWGPINFNNTGTYTANNTTTARTLTLTGVNKGDNVLSGIIQNPTSAASSLTKTGSGSWRLKAANTYTGTTRVDGGLLTLDYGTVDPLNNTSPVTTNGGILHFKGGAVTSDTVPTLNLAVTQSSGSTVKVSGGLNLTVTNLSGGTLAQRNDFIDLYEPGGVLANVLSVTGVTGWGTVNNVVMSSASASAGRASLVLRASDGQYSFPRLSATTAGTLEPLPTESYTELAPGSISMLSNTTNYLLKGSGSPATTSFIASGNLIYSTITIDTTAKPVNLSVGNFDLTPTGFGKAFLLRGGNDVTIGSASGNTNLGPDSAQWFHNFLGDTATFNLSGSLGENNQFAIFGGTGFTIYSGVGLSANFLVNGGTVRLGANYFLLQPNTANSNSPGPNIKISNGGVFEIGGSAAQNTSVDFSKPVGNITGGIRFFGDSGVSAYNLVGSKRIIDFSDYYVDFSDGDYYISQSLVWGSNFFLTNAETGNDGDYALKLSSPRSNATVEMRNKINLNGKPRVVEVANGSANVDAQFTGYLSGGKGAGLVKTGPGTLQLVLANTYEGETEVREGKLMVDSLFPGTSKVHVNGSGVLHITGSVSIDTLIINGLRQPPGPVTASANVEIASGGSLTVTGSAGFTPYQTWTFQKSLGGEAGTGDDPDRDGNVNLIEYAVGSEPKTPNGSVFTIAGTSPRVLKFNRASGRSDIKLFVESNDTLTGSWDTGVIAQADGTGAITGSTSVTATESAGVVTVTDSRTAVGKRFYRLRVETK